MLGMYGAKDIKDKQYLIGYNKPTRMSVSSINLILKKK